MGFLKSGVIATSLGPSVLNVYQASSPPQSPWEMNPFTCLSLRCLRKLPDVSTNPHATQENTIVPTRLVTPPDTPATLALASRRLLDQATVTDRVGLSRTTLWKMVKAGSFPSPVKLGGTRRIAWFDDEIRQWQASLSRTRTP